MSFYTQDELLRDETYWTTQIQLELFRQIGDYLKENKLSRTEFAQQLGVSKGYVSQILNGNYDHKLSKFVALCLAINRAPRVMLQNLDVVIDRAVNGPKKIERSFTVSATQRIAPLPPQRGNFSAPVKVDIQLIKLQAA